MKVTTRVTSAWKASRCRPLQVGQLLLAAGLHRLDAPLDLPHRIQVVGDLGAIARPQSRLEPLDVGGDRIQDAPVLARTLEPLRGGAAVPEETLEHGTRIVLGRQRRRRRAPRQRVHVDAAVAVAAVADEIVLIEVHLQRRQRRVAADRFGRNLVGRDAVVDIGPGGVLRMDSGQPGARSPRVIAVGTILGGVRGSMREPADDQHLIAERRERREDGGQLEVGA
jgi:hypothetical protein